MCNVSEIDHMTQNTFTNVFIINRLEVAILDVCTIFEVPNFTVLKNMGEI